MRPIKSGEPGLGVPRAAPEIKAGDIRYGVGGGKKDVRCPKLLRREV